MNADPFEKIWGGEPNDLSETSSIESYEDHRPVRFQLSGGNCDVNDGLEGGVASLQRGDDFGDGIPQRMYVVGRGRTKMFDIPLQGPRKFQGRAPLTASQVQNAFQRQFRPTFTQNDFVRIWAETVESEYDTIAMNGNEHNLIRGPGKFAQDIRLVKLMPLKDRTADINENVSRTEAIRKLRSLHTTLVKAFGPQWIRLVQGSRNVELVGRQMDRFTFEDDIAVPENNVSIMDPFADFRPEDLVLNTLFGERTFTNTSHDITEIQSGNGTKLGALFAFWSSDMVTLANTSSCSKVSQLVRQQDPMNAFHKVVVSPNENLLIAAQRKTMRRARGLAGGSIQSRPSLAFSQEPEDLLDTTLSGIDTTSRQGSVSRIHKIEKDFFHRMPGVKIYRNATSALFVVPKDHEDLSELDWDFSSFGRCSIATMSLGPDVQELWIQWFSDTDPNVQGPRIVGCASAYDCLQSFSRRIEVADAQEAMPDLEQLRQIVQTFQWIPLAGNFTLKNLSWSARHVEDFSADHEIAQELTKCKSVSQVAEKGQRTPSSVVFSIPGWAQALRSAPKNENSLR